jgi:hypothetical protein
MLTIIAVILVVLALGAFAYIWAEHGFKAAVAAVVTVGGAIGAGAAAFWHQISGATP